MNALIIRLSILIGLPVLASAQTQTLPQGWSMVGNDTGAAINASTVFGNATKPTAITPSVTSVWTWNNALSQWNFFAPSMTPQELSTYAASKSYGVLFSVAKGEGFWVNAKNQFVYDPRVTPSASGATCTVNSGGLTSTISRVSRVDPGDDHNHQTYPSLYPIAPVPEAYLKFVTTVNSAPAFFCRSSISITQNGRLLSGSEFRADTYGVDSGYQTCATLPSGVTNIIYERLSLTSWFNASLPFTMSFDSLPVSCSI